MFGAFVPPTDYILSFIRDVCARFSMNTEPPQLFHKKRAPLLGRSMRPISPNYSRRFRVIGHPRIILGGRECYRACYRNLTNSKPFRCVCWLVPYTYFSVGNRQSFRTHFLHNYSDGDIYSMFFRVSSTILPSIYSPRLPVWSTPVDFPCVYFVCWFSVAIAICFSVWYRATPARWFSVGQAPTISLSIFRTRSKPTIVDKTFYLSI